jgi:antitoxin Phd
LQTCDDHGLPETIRPTERRKPLNKTWQLHDAKNKFSKMVNCAITQGAQIVTRRGKKVVVIMSFEEYNHLQRQNGNLAQFLLASPFPGSDLNIERNKSKLRTIEVLT